MNGLFQKAAQTLAGFRAPTTPEVTAPSTAGTPVTQSMVLENLSILGLPRNQRQAAMDAVVNRYNLDYDGAMKLYSALRYLENYRGSRSQGDVLSELPYIEPEEVPTYQQNIPEYLFPFISPEDLTATGQVSQEVLQKAFTDWQATLGQEQGPGEEEQKKQRLALYERMYPNIMEGIRLGAPATDVWKAVMKNELPINAEQLADMYELAFSVSTEIPTTGISALPSPGMGQAAVTSSMGGAAGRTPTLGGWPNVLLDSPRAPQFSPELFQEALGQTQASISPEITPRREIPPITTAAAGALTRTTSPPIWDVETLRKYLASRRARPQAMQVFGPRST